MSPRCVVFVALLVLAGCGGGSPRQPSGPPAELIDVDLKDAPIQDALRVVATAGKVNLAVDPEVTGTVTLHVRARPWREVLDRIAREHALRVEPDGPVLRLVLASSPATPAKVYTGAPIALDFANTPIRVVAQTIADFAKVEIVVADDVQALVTLRVRDAPWDFALEHMARKYGLVVARDGNAIGISRR